MHLSRWAEEMILFSRRSLDLSSCPKHILRDQRDAAEEEP